MLASSVSDITLRTSVRDIVVVFLCTGPVICASQYLNQFLEAVLVLRHLV